MMTNKYIQNIPVYREFFYNLFYTILGAWIAALIVRQKDIITLVKNSSQRVGREKIAIRRGLHREVLLDFMLFTPAGVLLVYLFGPGILKKIFNYVISSRSEYILLGFFSYEFPFALLRDTIQNRVIRRILLWLKKGSTSLPADPQPDEDEVSKIKNQPEKEIKKINKPVAEKSRERKQS